MNYCPDELKAAIKKLKDGASLGMLDSSLKKQGVGSGVRDELLFAAKSVVNRHARIKNVSIGMLGVLLMGAGVTLLVFGIRARISVAISVFGLMVTIFGFYNACQNKL